MKGALRYVLAVSMVCGLDIVTSHEVTLWIMYLLPLGIATWNLGRASGYVVGVVCAVLHVLSWVHAPVTDLSLSAVIVLGSRMCVFVLLIELMSALRAKEVARVFHPTQSS